MSSHTNQNSCWKRKTSKHVVPRSPADARGIAEQRLHPTVLQYVHLKAPRTGDKRDGGGCKCSLGTGMLCFTVLHLGRAPCGIPGSSRHPSLCLWGYRGKCAPGGGPAGELLFLFKWSAEQGGLNPCEHLTAWASQGPIRRRISRASAMLNKHVPEATGCLPTAGKAAAPRSFIFKLWLAEVESGIGGKNCLFRLFLL